MSRTKIVVKGSGVCCIWQHKQDDHIDLNRTALGRYKLLCSACECSFASSEDSPSFPYMPRVVLGSLYQFAFCSCCDELTDDAAVSACGKLGRLLMMSGCTCMARWWQLPSPW